MKSPVVDSIAFQREALRSERIRILALLWVLTAVAFVFLLRWALVGAPGDSLLLLRSFALLAAMAAYELGMLAAVRRRIREERAMPRRVWSFNVVVETLLPTLSLLILTESAVFGPYEALVAPAVLLYFFFITLSTLRLSPALAILTGAASAFGYAAVLVYTLLRYPEPPVGSVPLGSGVYLTYAVFLLVGGGIAAGVARQIRSHVASALDEARLKERAVRDLEVARTIQLGLLPDEAPTVPGFDIAGWNRAADETGGDYFDWHRLADGRTSIAVADVTGHGIGSAMIASLARAYGRATLTEKADLGNSMNRMDALLGADLPSGKLVNLIATLVDPESGDVSLLSAGQAPILVYRAATQSIESSRADGVPLGVGLGLGYGPPREICLAPGDLLVLVTDGFFEWENAQGDDFGVERLGEAIGRASGLAAREIISAVHAEIAHFVGESPQADDLTAVVVKREDSQPLARASAE